MGSHAGLILANRAYCDHELPPAAERELSAGRGGLLAALRPAINPWDGASGTTWIGAGRGSCDRDYTDDLGYEIVSTPRGPLRHRRLFFDDDTWRGHYAHAANNFLWPLLHLVREPLPDLTPYYPVPQTPGPGDWERYREVNLAFARAALAEDAGTCWVHDYQLALVPSRLRALRYESPVGFFLHTCFPDIDVALTFLSRESLQCFREFVEGICGADLAGFQSEPDLSRFRRAVVALDVGSLADEGVTVDGRLVRCGVYPVGIDPVEVDEAARSALLPAIVAEIRDPALPLVIGLERADFTKGIPERLAAVAAVFRTSVPFTYAGIAAPTRGGVAAYEALGPVIRRAVTECEEAASEAGGRFLFSQQSIPWPEVVALQRDADVVFTSSLADGMNLVPLQAVVAQASRPDNSRGVIITGRDAGVAHAYAGFERDGLVPVDPLDVDAMTTVLADALRGQPGRVSDRLVAAVRANDAHAWASRFLGDLEKATC
jgi:trehalose-6-phosphate synthase